MQISTMIYKLCGKTVADGMYGLIFTVKSRLCQRLLNQVLYAAVADRSAFASAIK